MERLCAAMAEEPNDANARAFAEASAAALCGGRSDAVGRAMVAQLKPPEEDKKKKKKRKRKKPKDKGKGK
jgi:hypothetical protein